MGTCNVVTINRKIDDGNLLKIGEMRIEVKPIKPGGKSCIIIDSQERMTVNAIGDGFFTKVFCDDKSNTETTSKYSMFIDSGKLEIQIPNKYQLTGISPNYSTRELDTSQYSIYKNPSRLSMSLKDIACCKYMTYLDVRGFNCHGDLSNLSELTNLIELYIGDGVYGDIMSLKVYSSREKSVKS